MAAVQAATPDSQEAKDAVAAAKKQHLSLERVNQGLNAARENLVRLNGEYESGKALVLGAQEDVQAAKQRGKELERSQRGAKRQNALVGVSTSLQGIGDLADLDDEIQAGIDELQGAAFVEQEFADAANADRRLDAEIAQQESLGDFEAELAGLNATTPAVADSTPAASTPAPESSDSGSSDSSSDSSSE
jgi:predicted  nucleic acid-binding Zn-ribbon protein